VTPFSAVVVVHESAEHLARLLDSIDRHLGATPAAPQVVVVDTGSRDGAADLAAERGCDVVALNGNPGFGAANNAGLERARHDVTALLNPDVRLLDAGLVRLVSEARRCDALLAPRLLNADGSVQDSAHPRPGTAAELGRALLPARLAPQPYRASAPRRVGWAIAAALVARTATLRALGPFDPRDHLFYEDLDLCLRARAVELHPEVALLHEGGHSTGPDRLQVEARRRREVVAARLGPRALRADDAAQALAFARAALGGSSRAREQLRALRVARRA
jgi:GT2 family glycosyltransferase